jgi:hypothetical protein
VSLALLAWSGTSSFCSSQPALVLSTRLARRVDPNRPSSSAWRVPGHPSSTQRRSSGATPLDSSSLSMDDRRCRSQHNRRCCFGQLHSMAADVVDGHSNRFEPLHLYSYRLAHHFERVYSYTDWLCKHDLQRGQWLVQSFRHDACVYSHLWMQLCEWIALRLRPVD